MAYGSLTTKVHFRAEQSVKDIVSTVYHLVHNRHDLLPERPEYVVGNINHLTFTIDHLANYPILREQLRDLELTFGGAISLSSVCIASIFKPPHLHLSKHLALLHLTYLIYKCRLTPIPSLQHLSSNQDVEIMIPEDSMFAKVLYHELATAITPLKNMMNNLDAVMQIQPEPVTEWTGALDVNNRNDPMFNYIIAYGTDKESFPAIAFKLGDMTDDQEIGHLMAKVPMRTVVRIRPTMLNKGWRPGDSTAELDASTVSVWVYDEAARPPGQARPRTREPVYTWGPHWPLGFRSPVHRGRHAARQVSASLQAAVGLTIPCLLSSHN